METEANKMAKQPSYRFAGYTEAWEQRKLGEYCDITTGKLDANAMVTDGEYDFYTSGIQKYKIDVAAFEGPAITIAGNGATVGYMHYADGKFNAYQRTYVLSNFLADRSFIYSEIGRKLPSKIQQEARTGNIPYIVMDMLTKLDICLPSLPEQTVIGSFFQDIDQLISLQQRKLEVLKEQKKTYLKLLFPAKGQTKPALRFAGFEDDWKEVKLGEIIQSISSKNYITEYYEEGNNPVIQQGDIPIVGFSDNKPFNNFSNVILFGDHTLSLFKPETPFLLATDGIKILHSDLTTQPFLFIMLERYLPKSQGYKRHYSLLKNELSSLPSLPEQEVIGSFFQDLDKAIAKQEEKVNQLKESKQTLLRKMFI